MNYVLCMYLPRTLSKSYRPAMLLSMHCLTHLIWCANLGTNPSHAKVYDDEENIKKQGKHKIHSS